jgi:hypothetical protein
MRILVRFLARLGFLSILYAKPTTLDSDFVSIAQSETHIWGYQILYVPSLIRITQVDLCRLGRLLPGVVSAACECEELWMFEVD